MQYSYINDLTTYVKLKQHEFVGIKSKIMNYPQIPQFWSSVSNHGCFLRDYLCLMIELFQAFRRKC